MTATLYEPRGSKTLADLVAAARGFDRGARVHRGDHAAFVDGGFALVAWPGTNAARVRPHIYDPPGVLRLRNARNLALDPRVGPETLSPASIIQRLFIPARRARILHHRLHLGNALVVDRSRLIVVRVLRSRNPLAQPRCGN